MDYTSRLLLQKPDPDPVTGDFLDVSVLNANFDKLDAALGFTPVPSTARPAVPFQGQPILETDTGKAYVWGGSAYSQMLTSGAAYDANVGIGTAPHANPLRRLQILGSGVGGSLSQILLRQTGSATGSRALSTMGGSDTQDHWWVDFDGSMQWSSGVAGGDITLKRASAGVLDISTGTLTVGGKPLPGTQVAENIRETAVPNITSTEIIVQSVTFNVVNGARYRVEAIQHGQSSVVNDNFAIRIRWANGASVTNTSTLIHSILPNADVAGRGQPYAVMSSFVANATGQVTVGIGMVRTSGTGIVNSHGAVGTAQDIISVIAAG